MATKAPEKFVFNGLGFPIIVKEPRFHQDGTLALNFEKLARTVFVALIDKPSRLSGAEVRFARHHMELTQAQFAFELLQKDHSVVSKWEKKDLESTNMEPATEMLLRITMAKHIRHRIEEVLSKVHNGLMSQSTGNKITVNASEAA